MSTAVVTPDPPGSIYQCTPALASEVGNSIANFADIYLRVALKARMHFFPFLMSGRVLCFACLLACCVRKQIDDWFGLKDRCPYALYDDQSRLYAAILRMQLA